MQREDLKKFDLPDSPGVYLFTKGTGRAKKILYVGKATSLRDRVRSYFDIDLISTRGPRIVDMVTTADSIEHEPTPTVLEALVREAALIREHQPKANSLGKDDKSFLYVLVTDEDVPRIITERAKDIDFEHRLLNTNPTVSFTAAHGPFTSGYQLREALRLIRKIFPFFDTPKPVDAVIRERQRRVNTHAYAKVEFNRQIGLYPRDLDRAGYLRSIRNVSLFLSGRVKKLRETLSREMQNAAKEERFEEAAVIRKQLFALDHVQDVSLIRDEYEQRPTSPRIEAFDTAHIGGTNAIGVMTVVEDSQPVKKSYRTFTIKGIGGKSTADDIASLKEILSRRLGHPEWPLPKAFVIDGGKTHKKAAESVLTEVGVAIPVVAVVKDERHRPREVIGALRAGIAEADAVLANSEAHRFAVSKHRAARAKKMRDSLRKQSM